MENNYFTPDIEDIRLGYECEVFTHKEIEKFDKGEWKPYTVRPNIIDVILSLEDLSEVIRVPYLTKEQIEAEGWEKMKPFIISVGLEYNYIPFEKKIEDMEYRLDYNYDSNKLRISYGFGFGQVMFEGKCKDINTFRYICKLLNIK